MKRVFDILFVCLVAIPVLPMTLFFGLLIRFKLGSPVLFFQARLGEGGKAFKMVKFRSMTEESDSSGNLLPDEQRLTPFGRWLRRTSIDELPGLWNVLKGEMSIVGPRPLLQEYLPLFNARQKRRLEIRPGITGWAQVNGRNSLDWEKRFELDVWYVENRSLRLDLKIIWMTFFAVAKRDGISAEGHVTMPKFKGSSRE